MSETETPVVLELSKPSKLSRIKSAAFTTAIYGVPLVIVGGSMYLGFKTTKMQLETAKLALEAAKLKQ